MTLCLNHPHQTLQSPLMKNIYICGKMFSVVEVISKYLQSPARWCHGYNSYSYSQTGELGLISEKKWF